MSKDIIPKSVVEAKHLILPGVYNSAGYDSSADWDVVVNGSDVVLKDANGEHVLISEPELKDGWVSIYKSRLAAARGRRP